MTKSVFNLAILGKFFLRKQFVDGYVFVEYKERGGEPTEITRFEKTREKLMVRPPEQDHLYGVLTRDPVGGICVENLPYRAVHTQQKLSNLIHAYLHTSSYEELNRAMSAYSRRYSVVLPYLYDEPMTARLSSVPPSTLEELHESDAVIYVRTIYTDTEGPDFVCGLLHHQVNNGKAGVEFTLGNAHKHNVRSLFIFAIDDVADWDGAVASSVPSTFDGRVYGTQDAVTSPDVTIDSTDDTGAFDEDNA